MEWLKKAFAMHDPGVLQLKVKPAYDPLRSDPRFVRSFRKLACSETAPSFSATS
jgi:hypothetical protein